jgi:hypothetical protein
MPEGGSSNPRIKVFIDYWNFQLLTNETVGRDKTPLDWKNLGAMLAKCASETASIGSFTYEGTNIYTSYNPGKEASYYSWVQNFLNRQPGIQVYCSERRPKKRPTCPSCHKTINNCPFCKELLIGTSEKGVDALIVTDLIRLAWENGYDLAVLASSDSDLIPAVKFLDNKGKKVIHAGFRSIGIDLAKACWASFDIVPKISEIIRTSP